jgi:hypothetical protein
MPALDGPLPRFVDSECRALNSAVECHLHTVEVVGSNPTAPTNFSNDLRTEYRPFVTILPEFAARPCLDREQPKPAVDFVVAELVFP